MTNVTAIMAAFPNPSIAPIVCISEPPNYSTMRKAQTQSNANAASIHSNGGNGTLGHLVLTMAPAAYLTLSKVPFIPPVDPPLTPLHAAGATAAQITKTNCLHQETKSPFGLSTMWTMPFATCSLQQSILPTSVACTTTFLVLAM
jgi:hypothetical protein